MTPLRRLASALMFGSAAFGAALAAGAASSSCKPDTDKTAVPDSGSPITVGVSIGLTGDLAGTALPMQNAIRVAEQQINAYGGVLGRPVTFKIVDDTTDTGAVVQGVVQSLLDQGAVAMIGPIGSGQVKAVADIVAKRQIIELSATSTSPDLSKLQPPKDHYFFRTTPNDDLQGKAAAIFAYQGPGGPSDAGAATAAATTDAGDAGDAGGGTTPTTGCRHMAIVHNDDAYGNPFAVATTGEFQGKLGGTVVADIKVPTAAKATYSDELNTMVHATPTPECVVIVTYDPTCDEFVREIKAYQQAGTTPALPSKFFVVATDGSFTSKLIVNGRQNKGDPSSPTVVEGIYGTNPDPNPDTSQYSDFRHLYLSEFGLDPGQTDLAFGTAGAYDAAVLIALAIERAGGLEDHVKIRNSLVDVANPGCPSDATKQCPDLTAGEKSYGPAELGEALTAIRDGKGVDYTGAAGPDDFNDTGDVIGDYIIWSVVGGNFKTVQKIKAGQLGP